MTISFVIVAKNEADQIERCLKSVIASAREIDEVICVDSGSTDHTWQIMSSYAQIHNFIKVYSAPSALNSAMSRNLGFSKASGDIIFFLDGDIELYDMFVREAYLVIQSGRAEAVTGGLKEVVYDDVDRSILREHVRHHYDSVQSIMACGGSFVVLRSVLDEIGIFDDRFFRNQDIDMTLRISNCVNFVGLPEFVGVHHTPEYNSRIWYHFLNRYPMVHGMLARKHLGRKGFIKYWLSSRKNIAFGISIYVISITMMLMYALRVIDIDYIMYMLLYIIIMIIYMFIRYGASTFDLLTIRFLYPIWVIYGFVFESSIKVGDFAGGAQRVGTR